MFHFNDDAAVNLQLLLLCPDTNTVQCTQNPDTIIMMMHDENDDINLTPFLPMEMIIQMNFRSNGELFPRLVSTPMLVELMQIQPIRNHEDNPKTYPWVNI